MQVFAPAGQCYNALNFVINAYQGYQRAFESLEEIFGECHYFLNRLAQYRSVKMSKAMGEICCDTLRYFVRVCGKAIELQTSVLFKMATFAKVAFLSRDDFTDMLDEMKNQLARRELMQSTADTYKNSAQAKEYGKKTTNLLEDQALDRSEEKRKNSDKAILADALMFEDGKEPVASWTTTYEHIQQNTVKNTGQWLLQQKPFKSWREKKSDTPVLAIVGEEAAGKSYLAANTIQNLRVHGSGEGISSRHMVAFFFLGEKKENAGVDALGKSIIWQFAKSDVSYMQSAAATCSKKAIDPKDFLTELLINNHRELQNIDATFYIVINKLGDKDGNVHPGVVDFLRAAAQSSNKSVRILFTARQATIDKLQQQKFKFPVISMNQNDDDLRKYIDVQMDRTDVLFKTEVEEVMKLRDTIQKKLPVNTKRNYFMIETFLEEIGNMNLEKDIRKALDDAGGNLERRISADIKRLNDARTKEELEEINTMIIWITFAMERMTVEKMKAVLQFQNRSVSLTPLEERMRKKFLLFEVDNAGCIDFKSEMILNAIGERAETTERVEMSGDLVNEGEVDILKHFLRNVCPPNLVRKLQLNEHFDTKLKPPEEKIYKEDENTAHFLLARTCVGVLVDADSLTLKVLRGYGSRHLIDHMSRVNLALIDRGLKNEVGINLVKLFRDGLAIDNLFWAKRVLPYYPSWVFEDSTGTFKVLRDWLKHISPSLENDPKAEAWLREFLDGSTPLKTLLEPSVLRMAYYAFQQFETDDITVQAFDIVLTFTSKVRYFEAFMWFNTNQTSQFDVMRFGSPDGKNLTVSDFSQIENWCQEKLQAKKNSLWHLQMAIILSRNGQKSEAIKRCHEAIAEDKKSWRATFLLVKLTDSKKDAKDMLRDLIVRCERDASWVKEHQEILAEMNYTLGELYWARSNFDAAVAAYTKCLARPDSRYKFPFQILLRYHEDRRFQDILDSLELIKDKEYLVPMMLTFEYIDPEKNMHSIILDASLNKGKFDIIDTVYPVAIRAATKAKDNPVSFNLQHNFASILTMVPSGSKESVLSLLENAARVSPYTGLDPAAAFFVVGYRIGTIYLHNAKKAKKAHNEEEAKKWLQAMSDIIPEQVTESQMRLPLRLFATRYYVSNEDLGTAQKYARNTFKVASELLSDKDPTNDMFAYAKILFGTIPFGDVANATTALMLMKLESPDREFSIECSCGCGSSWDAPRDMYWCKDCIKVALKPQCKNDVTSGKATHRFCHRSHEHLYIPASAWDEGKMANFPEGQVPWNGEIITMKKWRSILGHKYNLNK